MLYYTSNTILLASPCLGTFMISHFQLLKLLVKIRITDEGSVPEMRILSILLIKSDFKWCIHLNRSLFLYLNQYKKRLLLRYVHHFESDLINNMDHMRISGTEPSSVILNQTKFKKLKIDTKRCRNKINPKGWCNKPTKL